MTSFSTNKSTYGLGLSPIGTNRSPVSRYNTEYEKELFAARDQVKNMAMQIADMLSSMVKKSIAPLYKKTPVTNDMQYLILIGEELLTLLAKRKYEYPENEATTTHIQELLKEGNALAKTIEDQDIFNNFSLLNSFFYTADSEHKKLYSAITDIHLLNTSFTSRLHDLLTTRKELAVAKEELKELLISGNHSGETYQDALKKNQLLTDEVEKKSKILNDMHNDLPQKEQALITMKKEILPSLEKVIAVYQHLLKGNTLETIDVKIKQSSSPIHKQEESLIVKTADLVRNDTGEKKTETSVLSSIKNNEFEVKEKNISHDNVKEQKKITQSLDELLETIDNLSKVDFNPEISDTDGESFVTTKDNYYITLEDFSYVQNSLIELIEQSLVTIKYEEKQQVSKQILSIIQKNHITSPVAFLKIVALQFPNLLRYLDDLLIKVIRDTEEVRELHRLRTLVMMKHAATYELTNEEFATYLTQYRHGNQTLTNYKKNSYFQIHTFNKIVKAYEISGMDLNLLTLNDINNAVYWYKVIEEKINRKERIRGTLIPYYHIVRLITYLDGELSLLDELHEQIPDSEYYVPSDTGSRIGHVRWDDLVQDLSYHKANGHLAHTFVENLVPIEADDELYLDNNSDLRSY